MDKTIINIIADDRNTIPYRPALREIGETITGTILLQQIMFYRELMGRKFYKFFEPCDHEKYEEGESWQEKLNLSGRGVRRALKHIGFKLGKVNKKKYGDQYEIERDKYPVIWYTDSNRLTWYDLNEKVLIEKLNSIYYEMDGASIIKKGGNASTTNEQDDASDIIPISENTAETTNNNTVFARECTEKLREFISRIRTIPKNTRLGNWTKEFKYLHERDGVPKEQIKETLEAYGEIMGKPYVPEAFSGKSFRAKFTNIVAAINRGKGKSSRTPKPKQPCGKPENVIQVDPDASDDWLTDK